jgi:uncharacterized membrane protein
VSESILGISPTVAAMCVAGIAVFLLGLLRAKGEIAAARGLEKIVALTSVCFAVPLAAFGTLHLFAARSMTAMVPAYMPWRMFWVCGVGVSLIAAAVSIAARVAVRWSGLLFGIMMLLFVAMIHFPGALARPHDRIAWTIVFRECAFGGGGWLLAAHAMDESRQGRSVLIAIGSVLVTITMIVFGVEHFLHPTGLPGVPLARQMPTWVPAQALIDYVTGAALLVAAGSTLMRARTRTVAASVGGWILLLVLVIYGPVLAGALADPRAGAQLEGVNYFADTLLFAAVVLATASVSPAIPAARK